VRLADTLRWVISQRLVPRIGGGRAALLEIMGSNLRTKESIQIGESEGKTFYEIIEASYTFGWRTFDHSTLEAYEEGLISEETAMLHCTKRGTVSRGIDNVKKRRGEAVTDVNNLRMRHAEDAVKASAPLLPVTLKLK
jgi:twitching motility protein PilT